MMPLVEGIAISIAVSIVTSMIVLRFFSREAAPRYAGAAGFAAGFLSAYAFLEPNHLSPSMHWHWLPWLIAAAAIIGPIGIASGVGTVERLALSILFAIAAAWLLVPTRASLQPLRLAYIMAFTGILALQWNMLDPLARKVSRLPLFVAIAVTLLSASALVAFAVSIRIGFLGAVAVAALAGGAVPIPWKPDSNTLRGLLGPAGLILGGVLLTAQLNDGLSFSAIGLIVVSPLMLWLFEAGPLARLRGTTSYLAKATAVGLPHVGAWWMTLAWIGGGKP